MAGYYPTPYTHEQEYEMQASSFLSYDRNMAKALAIIAESGKCDINCLFHKLNFTLTNFVQVSTNLSTSHSYLVKKQLDPHFSEGERLVFYWTGTKEEANRTIDWWNNF
ncbi:MAG: hypothetical protein JST90_09140 [Bacteroidetes bacterium]|nr:hypothetical protein [Bacteroidota bacterium]